MRARAAASSALVVTVTVERQSAVPGRPPVAIASIVKLAAPSGEPYC
jgi:hypothetical protein